MLKKISDCLGVGVVLFAGLFSSQAFAENECQKALPSLLTGVVKLPAQCVYDRPIRITESDTVLDCNGAVLDGGDQEKVGILIDSQGRRLTNVTVKNCTIRNFKGGGVRVAWKEVDGEKIGTKAEIYSRTPSKIFLHDLIVENNGSVGIYVDDYSTEVSIRNSVVRNSRGVGIYLEHSSRKNIIENNKFIGNGFGDGRREAIAIDSSADNVIRNNYFEGNAAGGIFLYKNCGEHMDSGRQVTRWQHSDNNKIVGNRFVGEYVGVWLASRQSKDLKKIGCGDPSMDADGKFFQDYANNNFVSQNEFVKNRFGVRVEGDFNQIVRNDFECSGKVSIDVPKTKREEFLHRPQMGNVIRENNESGCKK